MRSSPRVFVIDAGPHTAHCRYGHRTAERPLILARDGNQYTCAAVQDRSLPTSLHNLIVGAGNSIVNSNGNIRKLSFAACPAKQPGYWSSTPPLRSITDASSKRRATESWSN